MKSRRKHEVLFGTFLVLMSICGQVSAQQQEWVQRYGVPWSGPVPCSDVATAIAIDDSGDVIVTGATQCAGFEPVRYGATVKYSPSGDAVWISRLNSFEGVALALDHSGKAFAAGVYWTFLDWYGAVYRTMQYAPGGDTLLHYGFRQGATFNSDYLTAVELDAGGNVYVTGTSTTFGSETGYDYATVKHAPAGDTLWVRLYNGPGDGEDRAEALAVDDSGNVYVTGSSTGNGTGADYATIKYSPVGDTLWVRRYSSPGNGNDHAEALALDDSGNAYVTGSSATIKYSPNGDALWTRDQAGRALALDGSGNLFVAGTITVKYTPQGDTLWVGGIGGVDIAVGADGSAYVTGTNSSDYLTAGYSPSGNTLWVRRYNGPADAAEVASALAIDENNNVYVTGSSEGIGTGQDYATVKYSDPKGDLNCDGCVDLADVVLLGNLIDGLIDLTGTCGGGQADLDSDGTIAENDYNLLYDMVAGSQ